MSWVPPHPMPRPHAFFPFGRVQSTEGQTHAASESVHQPPPSKDDCERPPLSAESGVVCTPPSVYSAVVTAARSGAGEHEKEHNHVRTTAPRQRGGGTLIESKAGKISRATSVASSSVICVCVCVCVFGSGRRTAPGAAVLRVDDPPPRSGLSACPLHTITIVPAFVASEHRLSWPYVLTGGD